MNQKTKGILFIVCSAFCFALMNAFVRLAGDLPSIQKSFFRNAVALVFALVILLRERGGFRWKKGCLPLLLVRAGFGTVGILCNYYAIDRLLLSDASMLNKLSPFAAILFSLWFLHEKVKPVQAAAICVAFVGALCIIKPSFNLTEFFPALVGLCGGVAAGAAYTGVRALSKRGERGPYIVFFFSGFSCLVVLPWLLFNAVPMTAGQLAALLGAGLAAAGGQFSITAAYSNAPASEISVFDYSQIVFAAALGFFLFGQIPDWLSIVGYCIICGVSVGMFCYNRRALKAY
ncbi:MAG TPA: DMT family transporter [Candidatus Butyricicoccus avicola]|nr:DMT family transporter [Candidatus Butyricicoccus avicola]